MVGISNGARFSPKFLTCTSLSGRKRYRLQQRPLRRGCPSNHNKRYFRLCEERMHREAARCFLFLIFELLQSIGEKLR